MIRALSGFGVASRKSTAWKNLGCRGNYSHFCQCVNLLKKIGWLIEEPWGDQFVISDLGARVLQEASRADSPYT